MVNKVLVAYVATDFAFAATGAVMVAFCVIVQNTMFEVPTDGAQAVRNLLYQGFPLTGTYDYSVTMARGRVAFKRPISRRARRCLFSG